MIQDILTKLSDWTCESKDKISVCVHEEMGARGNSTFVAYPQVSGYGTFREHLSGNVCTSKAEAVLSLAKKVSELPEHTYGEYEDD